MDERQPPPGGKRDRYPASNPRDFVGGLAKGLEVIQTFSDATPRLTLAEVAQRTGLTRASARRVLLTMQTDEQLEHYLESVALRPYNASTIVDKAVLRDVLMKTRQDGFAWVAGEIVPSIKGLAVPVFHTSGRALAALTVSINRAELDDEAFVRRALPALKRASTRLSASMAALADPASSARMSMFSF